MPFASYSGLPAAGSPVKTEPVPVKVEPVLAKQPFPAGEQTSTAPAPAPDESPPDAGEGPERPPDSPHPDDEFSEAMEMLAAPLRKELDKLRNETDVELQ